MSGGITITITTVVNKAKLEAMLRMLAPKANQILDKSAFDIERTAKSIAPVDTGALRASIYVAGPGGSGGRSSSYASATSGAKSASQTIGIHSGRSHGVSFGPPPAVGEFERAIGPAVSYAVFAEMHKPYMAPAAEAHRRAFINAWYQFV